MLQRYAAGVIWCGRGREVILLSPVVLALYLLVFEHVKHICRALEVQACFRIGEGVERA